MSKILTLVFITLTSLISRAADNEGCVTITSLTPYDIQIQIDGDEGDA